MHVGAVFYECMRRSEEEGRSERKKDSGKGRENAYEIEDLECNAIYNLFNTVSSGKSVSHRIMSVHCTDDAAT